MRDGEGISSWLALLHGQQEQGQLSQTHIFGTTHLQTSYPGTAVLCCPGEVQGGPALLSAVADEVQGLLSCFHDPTDQFSRAKRNKGGLSLNDATA